MDHSVCRPTATVVFLSGVSSANGSFFPCLRRLVLTLNAGLSNRLLNICCRKLKKGSTVVVAVGHAVQCETSISWSHHSFRGGIVQV